MGRKNKASDSLGRSLIKDRFSANKGKRHVSDNSMLHTTEIQDGYDWGRLNLQSVTEESSFQEFLSTAELAGTEFESEKLNIKFVNPKCNVGLLSGAEMATVKDAHNKYKELLKIPRRPHWDATTTRDQLDQNEKERFLEWRRSLAKLQEDEGILLTPYEKNLEFWRQLWRVVERSDVIVQIVDARNPLLFRCEDLEAYVREVSEHKINVILINKADFLNEQQRQSWADFFSSLNVRVVFYSAILATEVEKISEVLDTQEKSCMPDLSDLKRSINELEEQVEATAKNLDQIITALHSINSNKLLTRDELIDLFKMVHTGPKVTSGLTTVGLVGYPNVGKSSTINSVLLAKKVSVSATPGKTKHFQTLFLDKELMLCDCPGLVMPTFVFTKAEMIINGILAIDQMRDHVPPVNLVCNLIPRHIIEDKYGVMLPQPMETEDPHRCPFAEELLNAYGYNRGFMTANGQPDNPRSARHILKDYMNGKLLYCHAPPDVDQHEYHRWSERQKIVSANRTFPPRQIRAVKSNRMTGEDLDEIFFQKAMQGVHTKGVMGKPNGIPTGSSLGELEEKPWKKINKLKNKKKREKLRRVYAHLDQH